MSPKRSAILCHPAVFCLIAIVLLLLVRELDIFSMHNDDPYISFRYLKNLLAGKGLVYNEGEYVEGFSNFLFMMILLPFMAIGAEPLVTAKFLGIASSLAILVLVYRAGREFAGESRWMGLIAPVFLAASPAFCAWSVGALETLIYVLFLLTAFLLHLVEYRDPKRFPSSVFLFAAAALTRPEGTMFSVVTAVTWCVAVVVTRRRAPWRQWLTWSVILAGILGAFLLWRRWYYGDWLPNSYYAKSQDLARMCLHFRSYLDHAVSTNGYGYILPAVIVFGFGMRFRGVGYPIYLAAVFVWIQVLFVFMVGADWMSHSRFFVPALPFYFLLVQEALWRLRAVVKEVVGEYWHRASWLKLATAGILLCFAVGVSLQMVLTSVLLYPKSPGGERSWLRAPTLDPRKLTVHPRMLEWVEKNIPPGSLLATGECGAIPYFTGLRVVDLHGLMDRFVARIDAPMFRKYDEIYIVKRNPDYILIFGEPAMRFKNPGDVLARHYRVLEVFPPGTDYYTNYTVLKRGQWAIMDGTLIEDFRNLRRVLMVPGERLDFQRSDLERGRFSWTISTSPKLGSHTAVLMASMEQKDFSAGGFAFDLWAWNMPNREKWKTLLRVYLMDDMNELAAMWVRPVDYFFPIQDGRKRSVYLRPGEDTDGFEFTSGPGNLGRVDSWILMLETLAADREIRIDLDNLRFAHLGGSE